MAIHQHIREHRIHGLWLLCAALFLLVGIVLIADGCASRRTRTVVVGSDEGVEVVYVETAPPALRVEAIPTKPVPKAVWIPGYWEWKGNKYVWVPGRWEKKPRGTAWAPGQWKKTHRGWVWVPGYWR